MSIAAAGDPLQPPPPSMVMQRQSYRIRSSHGSVGPVVGALAVIAVLGAIAVMIGRLCSGRRIAGHGRYNLESWFEAKCATCIDGRVEPAPRPVAPASGVAAEEAPPPPANREEEETARR